MHGSRRQRFPRRMHDARSLPFSDGFFDVIVSLDSFYYYGTDDLYLNYLARFVKPGGAIPASPGAGLVQEIDSFIPKHLRDWWTNDLWCLHSAPLVVPPLGAHQNYGHRDRGYDAGRLPALGWTGTELIAPDNEAEIKAHRS